MKEIVKKLGLPETATDTEILAAIDKNATNATNKKVVNLALGLPETATEKEVNAAADKMNLKVVDGKLINKTKDEGEEEEGTDDIMNLANSADVMKCLKNLVDRMSKMENAINTFKKAAVDNAVDKKIISLVSTGKVENKAEAIATAKAFLEKDFEVASGLYDSMPVKKIDLKAPGAINDIITKAAKEHNIIQTSVSDVIAEATEKTLDMNGKEIDLKTVKRPSVKDALNELNPKNKMSTEDLVKQIVDALPK